MTRQDRWVLAVTLVLLAVTIYVLIFVPAPPEMVVQ